MVPQLSALEDCAAFAQQYHMGFEYNDFFYPQILDSAEQTEALVHSYQTAELPEYQNSYSVY